MSKSTLGPLKYLALIPQCNNVNGKILREKRINLFHFKWNASRDIAFDLEFQIRLKESGWFTLNSWD